MLKYSLLVYTTFNCILMLWRHGFNGKTTFMKIAHFRCKTKICKIMLHDKKKIKKIILLFCLDFGIKRENF